MDVKMYGSKLPYEQLKTTNQPEQKNVVEVISDKVKKEQLNPTEKNEKTYTKDEVEKGIENVNQFLSMSFTSLKFQVHEDLDRLFVEVVDMETKEVVREIPPKEFLDMISTMLEYVGLFVDKRV